MNEPITFQHRNWHGELTFHMNQDPARLRVTRSGETTRDGEPYAYGMDLEPADIIRLRDYLTEVIESSHEV